MVKENISRRNTLTVELNIHAQFTGTTVVKFDNGEVKSCFSLRQNEFFGSLDSFIDAIKAAGYQVIPPVTQG